MSSGAIIIEQTIAGQTYETVWGAQSELTLGGEDFPLNEAAILEWFAGGLPADNFGITTDPLGVGYEPSAYGLVGSLVSFHRYFQAAVVTLTRLYITDGRKGTSGAPNIFYSLPLSLVCKGVGMSASSDPNNVAPANQAVLVEKVPKGFGKRAGRAFMRCCLEDDQLRVGGPQGVEIKPVEVQVVSNRLATAVSSSELSSFYDLGTEADQASVLAILNYQSVTVANPNPPLKGQVIGSTGVSSLRFGGVTGRQTNRPSKRN